MKKISVFLVALSFLLSACSTNRQNGDPASASSPSESSQSIVVSSEAVSASQDEPADPAAGTVLEELPVMTDEMAEYYHKYIPFIISSGIPLGTDFDEEHYFSARTYFLFHYAYRLEHGDVDFLGSTADLYQSSGYPAELVESTIQEYFLFDVDELRADKEYREADAVYYFEGGYGGGYYEPVVVAARQNGDLLELDIEQYGDLYTSGNGYMLERSNTLTLRLEPDGGWKYIANKVTYQL